MKLNKLPYPKLTLKTLEDPDLTKSQKTLYSCLTNECTIKDIEICWNKKLYTICKAPIHKLEYEFVLNNPSI